jgi:hypothetical protein
MESEEPIDEAIFNLKDKWQRILGHWKKAKGKALQQDEIEELKSNIHLLQNHLRALLSLKGLLENMWEVEKELNQVKEQNKWRDSEVEIKAKLEALHTEKQAINHEMTEMGINEYFLLSYFESVNDYREHTLPLPHGFMCHKEYARELKFLKSSIHMEEDIDNKNRILQTFCDLKTERQVIRHKNLFV